MALTVLEPEGLYPDTALEERVLGAGVRVLQGAARSSLAELPDALCAEADGLMTLRIPVPGDQLARFPRLKVVIRMGVGYDIVDRAACAARGILVCNVPDYGTQEVAEFAVLLALALRRGLLLYHDTQRAEPPAPWSPLPSPLLRRQEVQTFGLLGLGRIGTATALRARAFGYRVVFHDPHLPNGADRALGIARARTHGRAAGAVRRALHPRAPDPQNTQPRRRARASPAAAERRGGEHRARPGPRPRRAGAVPARRPHRRRRPRRDPRGAAERTAPEPAPRLSRAGGVADADASSSRRTSPSTRRKPGTTSGIKTAETMRDVLVEGLRTNVIPPEAD